MQSHTATGPPPQVCEAHGRPVLGLRAMEAALDGDGDGEVCANCTRRNAAAYRARLFRTVHKCTHRDDVSERER